MKLSLLMATCAILLWGAAPALAGLACPGPDTDLDTIPDSCDNCDAIANPAQHDVDGDDCGNRCDPDYDDSGIVTIPDFGAGFLPCFGKTDPTIVTAFGTCGEADHIVDGLLIPAGPPVGIGDFGAGFLPRFGLAAGPSGTTAGTTACP